MQTAKISAIAVLIFAAVVFSGCDAELDDCKRQNNIQRKRIAELDSQVQSANLQLGQSQRELDSMRAKEGIESGALTEKVAAMEKALADKQALIDSMKNQLMHGGAQLPVELSTMLEDFAAKEEMVEFDSSRGVVKFKSDLLFEKGSDVVASSAAQAVQSLCNILASDQATAFDIVVAGHSDDLRIGPVTREKHPTNWHLAAHRAISVLNIMTKNNIEPTRVSVRGFGEFRPIAPNKPNRKGNPLNRRVEIYIVAKGM